MPVWINVRTTPLPRLPFVPDVLVNAKVDANNKVLDPFSKGFFVRSVVLSPDAGTILNPKSKTIAGAMVKLAMEGDLSYAAVDAPDYLLMLRDALRRHRNK